MLEHSDNSSSLSRFELGLVFQIQVPGIFQRLLEAGARYKQPSALALRLRLARSEKFLLSGCACVRARPWRLDVTDKLVLFACVLCWSCALLFSSRGESSCPSTRGLRWDRTSVSAGANSSPPSGCVVSLLRKPFIWVLSPCSVASMSVLFM